MFSQRARQMERKLKFPNVCDAEDIMGQMPGGESEKWKSNCLLESVGKESRKVGTEEGRANADGGRSEPMLVWRS